MILGFGTIEVETAIRIINECHDAIEKSDTPVGAIKDVKEKYREESDKYAEMDRSDVPQRYSYFWPTYHRIYDGKYIIEFTFHHINRHHALSSDGWGLLITKWILVFSEDDGKHIFKEA